MSADLTPPKSGIITHHCEACGRPDAAWGYGWPRAKPDRWWCDAGKQLWRAAMGADAAPVVGRGQGDLLEGVA